MSPHTTCSGSWSTCSSSTPTCWNRGPSHESSGMPWRGVYHLLGSGCPRPRRGAAPRRPGRGGHRIRSGGSERGVRLSSGWRRNPRARQGSDRGPWAVRGDHRMSPETNGHASMRPAAPTPAESRSDDLASLYPFLYAHPENVGHDSPRAGDLEAVLAEVRRSTVDKVHQIVALRREVLAREGQRL